ELEESAIPPSPVPLCPHQRTAELFGAEPFPVVVVPEIRTPIAAVIHEGEELPVGHRRLIDAEAGHEDLGGRKFIVPAERDIGELPSEGGHSRGHADGGGPPSPAELWTRHPGGTD